MPIRKVNRFKILKWVIGIISILFILLVSVAWYLNYRYKPIITEEIKTQVYKSTDSLYNISFTNVTTNLITGNAVLKDVKIIADTNRFKQLIALKRAPNNLYTITLKKLLIKRFHPFSVLKDKKLNINLILFDKPEFTMINRQFDFNENRLPQPVKSPYDIISKILKEFSVETIYFRDASFKYINKNHVKPTVFSIANFNIVLKKLLVDSTSVKDPKRFFLLKDVILNLNNYSYATPDKLYKINLNQLDFKASTGELMIKKFGFIPLYDEMKFGEKIGHNVDRFKIEMDNIDFKGINLPLYVRRQELRAKETIISNGTIAVFNNSSLPKLSSKRSIKSFPHQLLKNIDFPIELKKVILKNINIRYAVYSAKSQQRGLISFEHTSGQITNLTNLSGLKAKDSIMKVDLVTYLMEQGKLAINFKFNLASSTGAFSYFGVLNNINARLINGITKPLGLLQINRGNVDRLDFAFDADNFKSVGKVNFRYYDLSVGLMRNDEEKGKLVKRGLASFLANALMINASNPNSKGKFISASVIYDRPANTSFFNLIWRSLFQGIKYSIGLTEEKRGEMQAYIEKFNTIKASRKERKTKRLERRLERKKEQLEKERRYK